MANDENAGTKYQPTSSTGLGGVVQRLFASATPAYQGGAAQQASSQGVRGFLARLFGGTPTYKTPGNDQPSPDVPVCPAGPTCPHEPVLQCEPALVCTESADCEPCDESAPLMIVIARDCE